MKRKRQKNNQKSQINEKHVRIIQNFVRHSILLPRRLTKLSIIYRQRQKVINEMINNEQIYVENLKSIIDIFVDPLLHSAEKSRKPILPKSDVEHIFSNVKQIHSINETFLKELSNMERRGASLGETILKIAPFFKLYTVYISNYDSASRAYKKCANENTAFRDFIQKCKSESKQFSSADIQSFLITPIQQIPRYKLLLDEIIRYTPSGHPDLSHLQKAASTIQSVANHLNEERRKSEALSKMIQLRNRFDFFDDTTFDTSETGTKVDIRRHLVREAKLKIGIVKNFDNNNNNNSSTSFPRNSMTNEMIQRTPPPPESMVTASCTLFTDLLVFYAEQGHRHQNLRELKKEEGKKEKSPSLSSSSSSPSPHSNSNNNNTDISSIKSSNSAISSSSSSSFSIKENNSNNSNDNNKDSSVSIKNGFQGTMHLCFISVKEDLQNNKRFRIKFFVTGDEYIFEADNSQRRRNWVNDILRHQKNSLKDIFIQFQNNNNTNNNNNNHSLKAKDQITDEELNTFAQEIETVLYRKRRLIAAVPETNNNYAVHVQEYQSIRSQHQDIEMRLREKRKQSKEIVAQILEYQRQLRDAETSYASSLDRVWHIARQLKDMVREMDFVDSKLIKCLKGDRTWMKKYFGDLKSDVDLMKWLRTLPNDDDTPVTPRSRKAHLSQHYNIVLQETLQQIPAILGFSNSSASNLIHNSPLNLSKSHNHASGSSSLLVSPSSPSSASSASSPAVTLDAPASSSSTSPLSSFSSSSSPLSHQRYNISNSNYNNHTKNKTINNNNYNNNENNNENNDENQSGSKRKKSVSFAPRKQSKTEKSKQKSPSLSSTSSLSPLSSSSSSPSLASKVPLLNLDHVNTSPHNSSQKLNSSSRSSSRAPSSSTMTEDYDFDCEATSVTSDSEGEELSSSDHLQITQEVKDAVEMYIWTTYLSEAEENETLKQQLKKRNRDMARRERHIEKLKGDMRRIQREMRQVHQENSNQIEDLSSKVSEEKSKRQEAEEELYKLNSKMMESVDEQVSKSQKEMTENIQKLMSLLDDLSTDKENLENQMKEKTRSYQEQTRIKDEEIEQLKQQIRNLKHFNINNNNNNNINNNNNHDQVKQISIEDPKQIENHGDDEEQNSNHSSNYESLDSGSEEGSPSIHHANKTNSESSSSSSSLHTIDHSRKSFLQKLQVFEKGNQRSSLPTFRKRSISNSSASSLSPFYNNNDNNNNNQNEENNKSTTTTTISSLSMMPSSSSSLSSSSRKDLNRENQELRKQVKILESKLEEREGQLLKDIDTLRLEFQSYSGIWEDEFKTSVKRQEENKKTIQELEEEVKSLREERSNMAVQAKERTNLVSKTYTWQLRMHQEFTKRAEKVNDQLQQEIRSSRDTFAEDQKLISELRQHLETATQEQSKLFETVSELREEKSTLEAELKLLQGRLRKMLIEQEKEKGHQHQQKNQDQHHFQQENAKTKRID